MNSRCNHMPQRHRSRRALTRLAPRVALSLIALMMALTATQAHGQAQSQAQPAHTIAYELEKPGHVSIGVYDSDGRLLRTLQRGVEQSAGAHRVAWDGLNRAGEPMSPGDYQWRLLRTPGFKAEYVTSLGINPDSAPYHKWVGNHGGAASVAVDRTGMYVAGQVTETAPVLLKQSLDGKTRHWTRGRGSVTDGRYQGGISLASDEDGTLYMLQQNGYLQPIDAERGKVRVSKYNRKGEWDVLPEGKQRKSEGGPTYFIYKHGKTIAGMDLAAHDKILVVTYRERDALRWLSTDDGASLKEIAIESPTGVAVDDDENVYVVSNNRVLQASPDGSTRTVISSDLESPRRLAIDETNDHLLVAERAPSHQIKRFSMDGELLKTYGRHGGRKQGTYVPEHFIEITDIEADGSGGFYVVEHRPAPRRVAHIGFDGQVRNQWYGGQPYYAWGEPDPKDPSKVWFNPGGWLTLAEVNYETGQWRVLENYNLNELGDGLVRSFPGHRGRWLVRYHDGQRYLVSQEGAPQVLKHADGELIPVSVIHRKGRVKRAAEIAGRGKDAHGFRWVDRNGDATAQPDEFTFVQQRGATPTGTWVADDFTLISNGNTRRPIEGASANGENKNGDVPQQTYFTVHQTTPRWEDGVPVYPVGDEPAMNEKVAETVSWTRTGSRGGGTYRDAQGSYYGNFNSGPGRHGAGWPTRWGGRSRFIKWDAQGNEIWKVGRHAIHGGLGRAAVQTPPGYLHVPINAIGETKDTIILADRVEWPALAWTKADGLYAGYLLEGRVDDGLPETVYHWWRTPDGKEAINTSDNAQGGRLFQRDDGTVLLYTQGRNSVPIYKIHGWDGWTRQQGTLTVNERAPHAKAQGTGLNAAYFKQPDITGTPATERVDTRIWHGIPRRNEGSHPVLDGFHAGPQYDWSDGVDALGGAESPFAVRWTGQFEAPLSEPFTFSVYARGGARLWIDGEQHVFGWNEATNRWETEPIDLKAGRRYDVQLDFFARHPHPACSLNWESPNIDRQRIPRRYLYPADIKHQPAPAPRPATQRIEARTFDDASDHIKAGTVRGRTIRGVRQRGFGTTGAYLGYQRIDFGQGVSRVRAEVGGRPAGDGDFNVTLEFRLGSPDGRTIATVQFNDRDSSPGKEKTAEVKNVTGVHSLYVVNATEKRWHFLGFRSFQFE